MAIKSRAIIRTPQQMAEQFIHLAVELRSTPPFDRGEVHAQKVVDPNMVTREILHVVQEFEVPKLTKDWVQMVIPNLPWAEDHFQERVSGNPLNPPPSEAYWPFAQQGNSAHKKDEKFSHTYPERFWPKLAGAEADTYIESGDDDSTRERKVLYENHGIRFKYGDLDDLLTILRQNPRSRQAYLPVWFPEDLTAARQGERVPCTLGYHFLAHQASEEKPVVLDCSYFMRSCDLVRFYRDDVYMAGRLLQFVAQQSRMIPGRLVLHIANLHCFVGDNVFLEKTVNEYNPKSNYNFGALM